MHEGTRPNGLGGGLDEQGSYWGLYLFTGWTHRRAGKESVLPRASLDASATGRRVARGRSAAESESEVRRTPVEGRLGYIERPGSVSLVEVD